MELDNKMIYQMLTNSPEEAEMAMIIIKNYSKTKDKKILRVYNYYKIIRQMSYETWSFNKGRETHLYPLSLKSKSYVDLSYSNITIDDLPENLHIADNLNLRGNKGLRRLPNNLTVEGSLYIANTNIDSIPKNLKVYSIIWIDTPLWKKHGEEDDWIIKEIRKNGGDIKSK